MPRGSSVVSAAVALLGVVSADTDGYTPTCFKNTDIQHTLPLAPASYPEELQGIFWMDQGGFYGHSDVGISASPDLSLSFGDTAYSQWDPQTRSIQVTTLGPAWAWQDNLYACYTYNQGAFNYTFQGNEDLSSFTITPSDYMPGGPYTMDKIKREPNVVCPPPPGTSKEDIVKCAVYDRVSHVFGEEVHYYVWRIVDGKGNPIQPYYDEYQKFANYEDSYSTVGAWTIGLKGDCTGGGVGFRGLRSSSSSERAGSAPVVVV